MKNIPELIVFILSILVVCFAPKIIVDIFALLCLLLLITIIIVFVLDKKDDKNDNFK